MVNINARFSTWISPFAEILRLNSARRNIMITFCWKHLSRFWELMKMFHNKLPKSFLLLFFPLSLAWSSTLCTFNTESSFAIFGWNELNFSQPWMLLLFRSLFYLFFCHAWIPFWSNEREWASAQRNKF